jgi:hypothetical protein
MGVPGAQGATGATGAPGSGANASLWSQFPAIQTVSMANFDLSNVGNFFMPGGLTKTIAIGSFASPILDTEINTGTYTVRHSNPLTTMSMTATGLATIQSQLDMRVESVNGDLDLIGDDLNLSCTNAANVLNITALGVIQNTAGGAINNSAGGAFAVQAGGLISILTPGSIQIGSGNVLGATTSIEKFDFNDSVITKVSGAGVGDLEYRSTKIVEFENGAGTVKGSVGYNSGTDFTKLTGVAGVEINTTAGPINIEANGDKINMITNGNNIELFGNTTAGIFADVIIGSSDGVIQLGTGGHVEFLSPTEVITKSLAVIETATPTLRFQTTGVGPTQADVVYNPTGSIFGEPSLIASTNELGMSTGIVEGVSIGFNSALQIAYVSGKGLPLFIGESGANSYSGIILGGAAAPTNALFIDRKDDTDVTQSAANMVLTGTGVITIESKLATGGIGIATLAAADINITSGKDIIVNASGNISLTSATLTIPTLPPGIQSDILYFDSATQAVSYGSPFPAITVQAATGTISLTPSMNRSTYILTGVSATQTFTSASLTGVPAGWCVYLRNGNNATGLTNDITISINGTATLHAITGTTNTGGMLLYWTGATIVKYL